MARALLHTGVIVVLTVAFAAACISPAMELTPEQRRAVEHGSHEAPTGRVAWLAAGEPDGPRLIFVHGTPGDATNWIELLTAPLPGWRSIAVDRPGFGGSDPDGAVPSLDDQAAALEPLLEEQAGRWPILVGHSLGAAIVAHLAARRPDRVGGLVIVAGSLDPDLEAWHWYNRAAGALEPVLPRALRNSNRELRPFREELLRLRDELGSISCPVAIVHGRRDELVPLGNVDYLERHLVGAAALHVEILDGGDHFLPWNAAPSLRDAIRWVSERP